MIEPPHHQRRRAMRLVWRLATILAGTIAVGTLFWRPRFIVLVILGAFSFGSFYAGRTSWPRKDRLGNPSIRTFWGILAISLSTMAGAFFLTPADPYSYYVALVLLSVLGYGAFFAGRTSVPPRKTAALENDPQIEMSAPGPERGQPEAK